MSLYGGMSKGERNRIKIRVRSAMAAQAATEGRFLGGRPPYGYRLVDLGAHPSPAPVSGRTAWKPTPAPRRSWYASSAPTSPARVCTASPRA